MNNRTAIFCDFDGTIATRDVGYSIFKHFSGGRTLELLPDWKSGRMTSREILRREAEMAPLTEATLIEYLREFEIDPGFPSFVEKCRKTDIDLKVVSDGVDLYIRHLLERENLSHLPLITNHGYIENDHLTIEFPHVNHYCKKCGSCKGERIQEYRAEHGDDIQVVFVGDGFSDACATTEADVVFAKKDLERYCRENDIAFVRYADFFDVARELESRGVLA